jgi:hypothetical protein
MLQRDEAKRLLAQPHINAVAPAMGSSAQAVVPGDQHTSTTRTPVLSAVRSSAEQDVVVPAAATAAAAAAAAVSPHVTAAPVQQVYITVIVS